MSGAAIAGIAVSGAVVLAAAGFAGRRKIQSAAAAAGFGHAPLGGIAVDDNWGSLEAKEANIYAGQSSLRP